MSGRGIASGTVTVIGNVNVIETRTAKGKRTGTGAGGRRTASAKESGIERSAKPNWLLMLVVAKTVDPARQASGVMTIDMNDARARS